MAEYWKSAPRYWCKQCKIFIRDTAFEKAQHEATGKHQGNLKRFLRDIHRDNERQQRDSQRAKNEVERLRQAISGSTGNDGDQPPWKRASAATAAAPPTKKVSMEERKKQMEQLAEMGVAIPEEFRGDMALAGEWQTVSEKIIHTEETQTRKRKHDVDEEEEEAKREAERFVSKGWGSSTRRYPGAQDDVDLDALLESTKDVKGVKPTNTEADTAPKGEGEKSGFVPVKVTEGEPSKQDSEQDEQLRKEDAVALESTPVLKSEPEEPVAEVVFKKRKPKVMRK